MILMDMHTAASRQIDHSTVHRAGHRLLSVVNERCRLLAVLAGSIVSVQSKIVDSHENR